MATSPRDDKCGRAQYDDEHESAQYDEKSVHGENDTMGFR